MATPLAPEDTELIHRIQQRDQSALITLHERYRNLVYSMAVQVLKNASSAEEVTQDIFFQVWRWPEKWDAQKGRFTSWLLTVTRYTAIDYLRRQSRQPPMSQHSLEHLSRLLAYKSSAEERHYDDGHLLRSLINDLPLEQREMIQLAYFQGMTHSQIAAHVNLPLGTVKSRLRLALQKLKDSWLEALESQPESEELE